MEENIWAEACSDVNFQKKNFLGYHANSEHSEQSLMLNAFSLSSWVCSILSTKDSPSIILQHFKSSNNILLDYLRCNPSKYKDKIYEVCEFVHEHVDNPMDSISVNEIKNATVRMLYTTRSSWLYAQKSDADIKLNNW